MLFAVLFFSLFSSATDASFKSTMEGWQKITKVNYNTPRSIEKTEITKSYKSPFLKEEMEVALNIHPKASDMVLIFPGTFGGYDSPELLRVGTMLYERGYSILRVPNPQSRHVVKLQPTFAGLNFQAEAELYKDLIEQVRKDFPFTKLHMVGTSYGAFVAAVLSQKLGENFQGHLVLLSPPKNLLISLQKIDGYFDEMKEEITPYPLTHLWVYLRILWHSWMNTDVTLTAHEAKALVVISGFHNQSLQIRRLADKAFNKVKLWHIIPALKKDYPQFFDEPEKLELLYWVCTDKHPWHIFTTTDDFINPENAWPIDSHITVYPGPGHAFHYLVTPEFEKTLFEMFK